jgi:hypothetical protein
LTPSEFSFVMSRSPKSVRQRPAWPAPTARLAGNQFLRIDLPIYIQQLVRRELARPKSFKSSSSRGRRGAGSELHRRRWWLLERQRRFEQAQVQSYDTLKSRARSVLPSLQVLRSLLLVRQSCIRLIGNWRGAWATVAPVVLYPDVYAPLFVPCVPLLPPVVAVALQAVPLQASDDQAPEIAPRRSARLQVKQVEANHLQGFNPELVVKHRKLVKWRKFQIARGMIVTCQGCYETSVRMSLCSRCKAIPYCSRDCQRSSWGGHKPDCFVFDQALFDILTAL